MSPRVTFSVKAGMHGQMKLARLLEMSEREFEDNVRELESLPLFSRLKLAGAVGVEPYSGTRFASRRFGGWGVRTATDGLPDLIDGQGDVVQLIRRVGQERFEELFLGDGASSDENRARLCGISLKEALRLRDFVDRVYVQSELASPSVEASPAEVYSAVAGVEIVDGRPVLGFFNREIWKGRYRVDEERFGRLRADLSPKELRGAESLLKRLEFLDRRKTTLYRVLEALLVAQADYFVSGIPDRRRPLTQLSLAMDLEISPSVLNRLLSNKSIQLPWGLEAPLKVLVPSAKSLRLDGLYALAQAQPQLSDSGLQKEMARRFAAKLSRRSIAQYRQDLGVGRRGKRDRS
jgi:hypothetical protein